MVELIDWRKEMKKLLAAVIVLFSVLLVPTNVLAMQFSDPVLISTINTRFALNRLEGTEKLISDYHDFSGKTNTVRVYVDTRSQGKFVYAVGEPHNLSNRVGLNFSYGGKVFFSLYEINGDDGNVIYIAVPGNMVKRYQIIGRKKNGKYVCYVDPSRMADDWHLDKEHLEDNYSGQLYAVKSTFYVESDTIVFDYSNKKYRWQYRFKWDDNAQWFGVEYTEL